MEKDPAPENLLELIVCRCRRDAKQDGLGGKLDSPARPIALVKMNAATSKKMTKTRNFNPLYYLNCDVIHVCNNDMIEKH